MLILLVPVILLIPTAWVLPAKHLWSGMILQSLCIAGMSLHFLKFGSPTGFWDIGPLFSLDPISAPLCALTSWLMPLMLMASQNHLSRTPIGNQRAYIMLLVSLQALLMLAFASSEMISFYVLFEATLIPTLIVITRWGTQTERLSAGTYFLFYTLAGSLPLLVALLLMQSTLGSLSLHMLPFGEPTNTTSIFTSALWWAACLVAFLVKMPLYGLHLWLPKAHVEAPVAGSMILAAVLLKLGGYGMMRLMITLEPLTNQLSYPFIILALWGVVMTSSICLRQTDLKSLIAYSSVSHMGLVAAAILIQTPWSFTGAFILMIAHGLTSSALFCLANINYERTHSRTMLLARGLQMIFPLMAMWWFVGSLANLALPPLPNLMGELIIIVSLFNWTWWTLILTGVGTLITAAYSLHMFLTTQRGQLPAHIIGLDPTHSREHVLILFHMLPLLLLTLKPNLIGGPST
uniref:NADH-ubiquinone oxidoreductase chain 4 n=1 Tax=Parapercis cylindrica TaxID=215381 RepID=A0A1V1FSY0_9TELE|nr:NADH dehydrogenase subunit 4 [Parapercis cylindrica]